VTIRPYGWEEPRRSDRVGVTPPHVVENSPPPSSLLPPPSSLTGTSTHRSDIHRLFCRVPTAFTGYSFHVVEAVIVFFNEILVCFFLPIHARVHR